MASQLARAHIEAQARLRRLTGTAVERVWHDLPGYDRADVDQWLSTVLPVVSTAKRTSVAITDAYLAMALGRAPLGVDAQRIIAGLRNGADPATVYERPFVTLWTALGNGTPWEQAVSQGLDRAVSTAGMDVQLAFRSTANEIGQADDNIYGYQRVADDGACDFCQEVDGAYLKDADSSPLHNNCGCGVDPLTAPHPRAAFLPSGASVHDTFAIHEHGELGPVLTDPSHDFTTAAAALS